MAWGGSSRLANSSVKSAALIKLSPSNFPTFLGTIEDQEEFQTKAEEEKEQDKELYNVFKNLFHKGKAYNMVTSYLKDDAGNAHNQAIGSGNISWSGATLEYR
eukprot:2137554-Ditylum_brightwellii.AAC.1